MHFKRLTDLNIMEKWNELNFILSEKINSIISEADFERYVIEALRILGWSEFLGDLKIRQSVNIGASNRVTPDIIVKSGDKNLFVIELKQPSLTFNSEFTKQLTSYLRILKLEFGIIIGEKIQLVYDGKLTENNEAFIFEEIEFKRNNSKGVDFVNLFSKENFDLAKIENFVTGKLEERKESKIVKQLKEKLLSDNFIEELKDTIKVELLTEYDEKIVEIILDQISIKISDKVSEESTEKRLDIQNSLQEKIKTEKIRNSDYNSNKKEIEISKIGKKVPTWFKNPNLICSQILLNFFHLKKENNSVSYELLENSCKNIKTFKSNFDQMKNFGEKNHGKVFEKVGSTVTLWEPIRGLVENEFKLYKQRNE